MCADRDLAQCRKAAARCKSPQRHAPMPVAMTSAKYPEPNSPVDREAPVQNGASASAWCARQGPAQSATRCRDRDLVHLAPTRSRRDPPHCASGDAVAARSSPSISAYPALAWQPQRKRSDGIVATDHSRQLDRQILRVLYVGGLRYRWLRLRCERDRCDEAIAASRPNTGCRHQESGATHPLGT